MLTEMLGKGGTLCSQARTGQLRCPLIVRPTSEDVVTGHLFQSLRCLNARWWLADLLNEALGTPRFRRQVYRGLKIELWQNQPRYPRELIPWEEGSTQVDVLISWQNPPTDVFVEMKYLSGLSANVTNDTGESGFPSDQLIRNIRVGLNRCGYFHPGTSLFPPATRDLIVLVVAPIKGQPLVQRYRDPDGLRRAIPHAEKLIGFPRSPFIGELGYTDIVSLLRRQTRWFNRAERRMIDDLTAYLEFKVTAAPLKSSPRSPEGSVPATETSSLPDRLMSSWNGPAG